MAVSGVGRIVGWLRARNRGAVLLVGLGAIGYALRVALWRQSEGSNDIRIWRYFGETISKDGLGAMYLRAWFFNHPPLMGLWGAAALRLSESVPLTFAQVFKIPSLLAELGTGIVLLQIWRAKGQTQKGAAAFAAYGLSLSSILISGYHGNTDALYFFLSLLAAYLLEAREAPFWAGVSLGASLNVKLIPVLIGLPLATRCRGRRGLFRYGAGALVGFAPFPLAVLGLSAVERRRMLENVFHYASSPEYWGIELVVRSLWKATASSLPELALGIRMAGDWYIQKGGVLLLLASAALALWQLFGMRRRLDAYELVALSFALFLMVGSGFAVQYVGCVVAPLLACTVRGGAVTGLTTGVMILAVYLHFVVAWHPIYSRHLPIPAEFAGLATLAWLSIAAASYVLVRRAVERPAPTECVALPRS